jgi:hypothetical protein
MVGLATVIYLYGQLDAKKQKFFLLLLVLYTVNYLSLIFRKITILYIDLSLTINHKSVDFMILVVNFTILYC